MMNVQINALPLEPQITKVLVFLSERGGDSLAVRTNMLFGGDTLNLSDVLPEGVSEEEVLFISVDSDNLVVSEGTLKVKGSKDIWMKGCKNSSEGNPKYNIVFGNTREKMVRGCNDIMGRESKTCAELGGVDICLSNEFCSGGFLFGAVDTDNRCCATSCIESNLKSCEYLGGKSCSSDQRCTKGVWVTDIIENGTWVREDLPEGAHVETRRINGTLIQTTYGDGYIIEEEEVERQREEKRGFCCTGKCL